MIYSKLRESIRNKAFSLYSICTRATILRPFFLIVSLILCSGTLFANPFCKLFYIEKTIDIQKALRSCHNGFCNKNVIYIARALIEAGIHPDEIKMIIISPNSVEDAVMLWNGSIRKSEKWAFHTLLQVGDFFVDADADINIRPMRMEDYARKMLGRQNVDFKFLDVIPIPYEQYELTATHWGALDHYHNRFSFKRKRVPLSDYLNQYSLDYKNVQADVVPRGAASDSVEAAVAKANYQFLTYYSYSEQLSIRHYIPPEPRRVAVTEGKLLRVNENSVELLLPDGNRQEVLFSLMDPTYILEIDLPRRHSSVQQKPKRNFFRILEWAKQAFPTYQR